MTSTKGKEVDLTNARRDTYYYAAVAARTIVDRVLLPELLLEDIIVANLMMQVFKFQIYLRGWLRAN